jgi:hypothetical protein
MEPKFIGWTLFWNDAAQFSNSFQNEMSNQLLEKFNLFLGSNDKNNVFKFLLQVGLTDMKISRDNDYMFALVDIISPTSRSKTLTTYWKTAIESDLNDATKSNSLNGTNIEFGWCEDFDTEYFLQFLKPKKNLDEKAYNLNFRVEYDYTLYPDLSLTFHFTKNVEEQDLQEIKELLETRLSNAYVSEITNEHGLYLGIIDFQNCPYSSGINDLQEAFSDLSKLSISSEIAKIVVE